MTSSPEALEALARAYDREDASQRGEPTPWDDVEDLTWKAERIACAQVGLAAYLASSPEGRQEAAVAPKDDRFERQVTYSCDLQCIIEDLCHNREIRMPETTARFHYDMAVAYRSTLIPAKPAVEVVEALKDETAWLIELRGNEPKWWSLLQEPEPDWTRDASKALRFARKQDAEAYINDIGWTEAFASEHMWPSHRSHDWFEFKGMKCCRSCGNVWNDTSDTRSCKGPAKVGPRALQAPATPDAQTEVEK